MKCYCGRPVYRKGECKYHFDQSERQIREGFQRELAKEREEIPPLPSSLSRVIMHLIGAVLLALILGGAIK